MSKIYLALLLEVLTQVSGLAAQSRTGTIRGTVRDQSKASIPDVQITLTNSETKATYKIQTNEAGEYKFDVPAGIYALTAELSGFNRIKVFDITVNQNESKRIDPITLAVGKSLAIPIPLAPVPNPSNRL